MADEEEVDAELDLPDMPKVVASLEELVQKEFLTPERASFARQKIEELHAAFSKSKATRRKLTNDKIDFSLRLQTDIEDLKKAMQLQADDETTMDLLREDAETAENEVLFCREREQALFLEETDLLRAQEEFKIRISEIEKEHAAALAPQMLQLKIDIEELKKQIQDGAAKIEQCTKEGDALLSSVKGLHVQEQRQFDKVKEIENEMLDLQNTKKELIEEHAKSCIELDKIHLLIDQRVERLENEVLESIELEYARHQQMGELASLREHMCRLMSSKEIIDEKLIEVDRLNGFINTAEKEMAMFRKQYETCVLDRNHVGISLIDRNDELCILYEKSNVQEELFKISDIEMSKRDNEVAFLKHQVGSLERSILICYTFVPKSRELRNTISALKHELKRVRAESERLSDLVERPDNTARWKLLEGLDPSEMQLVAKLTDIEEHLSEREDQSLEKDLILEEVTALAEDVRKQTAEGWKENLPIGKKLNYYQHCIRIITRRMMATVSEFSLVQATTMSLQKEKDALSLLLEEAYDKLDAGEAPTADAEREWARMEQEQPAIGESNRSTASLLTGEQRTNAYIQEELELPKPFGVHAPFKPSEPGSTMRHIRRPKPKPIEV